MSNVIFGLNGKDKAAITCALKEGYQYFDGGDTYGNTTNLLFEALSELHIAPNSISLIYKIDLIAPGDLKGHIEALNRKFGGPIAYVLIHNRSNIPSYTDLLVQMKRDGLIRFIGVSNINQMDLAFIKPFDCFEFDAMHLLYLLKDHVITEKLRIKEIFVYHFIQTIQSLFASDPDTKKADSRRRLLLFFFSSELDSVLPIASSSQEARIKENLKWELSDEEMEDPVNFADYQSIGRFETLLTNVLPAVRIPAAVIEIIRSIVTTHQWDSDDDFSGSANITKIHAEEMNARSRVMAINPEQLNTMYQMDEDVFNLNMLFAQLYEVKQNCDRVRAFDIIQRILFALEGITI